MGIYNFPEIRTFRVYPTDTSKMCPIRVGFCILERSILYSNSNGKAHKHRERDTAFSVFFIPRKENFYEDRIYQSKHC